MLNHVSDLFSVILRASDGLLATAAFSIRFAKECPWLSHWTEAKQSFWDQSILCAQLTLLPFQVNFSLVNCNIAQIQKKVKIPLKKNCIFDYF